MHLIGKGSFIRIVTKTGKESHHPIEYMHLRCNIMHERYTVEHGGAELELAHVGEKELVHLRHKDERYGPKGDLAPIIIGHDTWLTECTAGGEVLGRVSARELLARKGSKGVAYILGRTPIRIESTKAITVDAWQSNAAVLHGITLYESARDEVPA